jgi:hypothetical protein
MRNHQMIADASRSYFGVSMFSNEIPYALDSGKQSPALSTTSLQRDNQDGKSHSEEDRRARRLVRNREAARR